MLTDDDSYYQKILDSEINSCYSDGDDKEEDDLFQMDDVPNMNNSHNNSNNNQNQSIDMQVRYYTPTNEPPYGLSQSVVTNDTDYLRRNIMNLRTKSIMVMDYQEEALLPLEDLLEELEENDNNSCQSQGEDDRNEDYISQQHLIPAALSNNKREKNIYSQSAPSAPSILSSLPEFLRFIYTSEEKTLIENDDNDKRISVNEKKLSTPKEEESIDSPIIIIDDSSDDVQTVIKLDDNEITTNEEVAADQEESSNSTIKEEDKTTTILSSPTTNNSFKQQQQQQPTEPKIVEQQQPQQKSMEIVNILSNKNRQHKDNSNRARLETRKEDESSFNSWSRLASLRYREDGRIYFQRRQWLFNQLDSVSREKSRLWEEMHTVQNYENFMKNPFIIQCIIRHFFSIKVTSISLLARFKDIERHFFSPHVVSIRFIRLFNCAYVAYRNYDKMIRAISTFDKTAICGKTIYCRQSFYGELDKDDEKNTRILLSQSRYRKRHIIPRHYDPESHDTFVPEHHGIIQKSIYSVLPTRNSSSKNQTENEKKKSSHPIVYLNRHHNYVFNRIFLGNPMNMYSPYHYVILKPWTREDIEFSQMSQYWSFSHKVVASLNQLFKTTPYVVFIFGLRNSKSYQGYAIMNSEIVDLAQLSEQDLIGTPFFQLGEKFKTCSYGRYWRFSCKVEWIAIQMKTIHKSGGFLNPWCKDIPIRYSKDCTIIEPNLGHRIIDEFSY